MQGRSRQDAKTLEIAGAFGVLVMVLAAGSALAALVSIFVDSPRLMAGIGLATLVAATSSSVLYLKLHRWF